MEALAASGVYLAVSVSAPTASAPAGMLIVATPLVSGVAAEAYVPLVRITEPVGVALPAPPLTVIVIGNADVETMLLEDGMTVIVGVMSATPMTVTEAVWEAPM